MNISMSTNTMLKVMLTNEQYLQLKITKKIATQIIITSYKYSSR